MARCCIKLLGSMQLTLDGSPLQGLESAKVCALLAYLAVECGQVHTRERLAGLFWPEMSEAQARHSLSQAVHNLRQALGEAGKTGDLSGQPGYAAPFLLVTAHTVQFNPLSDHRLDLREFEQALSEVRQHTHRRRETCRRCSRAMAVAEQLYRGDFLTGISLRGCQAFEEWALVWRERLHRQMCEVLSDLTRTYETRHDLRRALALTERWVQMDPFGEPAQRSIMRILALSGQRTQALVRYEGFRKMLWVELAVEPGREMQQLYRRILNEETDQATSPGMPGKLPVPLTPFVGREAELAELSAWLRDRQARLVTLLGPGGSGKTRLALQAAHGLRYDFPDGIFLVSLSGTASSQAFLPALASTLGVIFQPGWGEPLAQLLGYLQHRRLLLILDSFEESLDACSMVIDLLQGAGGLQVLVTSRVRLNVHAEQVFPLEGLEYPDPASLADQVADLADYSALQLFHNTAGQVRPSLPPDPAHLPHLARICQLVDGMPLGIILAAAWMADRSPAEIAGEIEDSLDFLTTNWSDLPHRQRSLRATLDHSWKLLSDTERQAFQMLSVFQGTFTHQAAEQVARVSAPGLRALVDKSMLQGSAGSYRMHDMLHQYGIEKLASEEVVANQVREAHAVYYLQRLAGCESRLKSAQRSETLRMMDAEINDLQAAWKWVCQQANTPLLGDSLSGLCLYYEMRVRYREGEQACQVALAALPVAVERHGNAALLYARLLLWRASFLTLAGQLETAKDLRQQAGELLDWLEGQGADTRRPRAMYWQAEGEAQVELKAKLDCYQRGIALYQALGDSWRQAGMLVWAGEYAMRLGDPSQALAYQLEALRLARLVGEPGVLLNCMRQSTYLYLLLSQFETSNELMHETVTILDSVDELPLRATAQMHLGMQYNHCGRFLDAIQILEQSVPVLCSLGYRYGAVYGMNALGFSRIMKGEFERGETILQDGFSMAEQGGFLREAAVALEWIGLSALALGHVDQALSNLRDVVKRYRRMQFAGELGMALGGLALAQGISGDKEAARTNLREALPIAEKTHNLATMLTCLPALVRLFICRDQVGVALRMHRLHLLIPALRNNDWYAVTVGNEMEAKWRALSPAQQAEMDRILKGYTPFSIIPEVLALLA